MCYFLAPTTSGKGILVLQTAKGHWPMIAREPHRAAPTLFNPRKLVSTERIAAVSFQRSVED